MKVVPLYEAKNRLSELIAAAGHGEVVSITRRGQAVARLVAEPAGKAGRAQARKRIAATFERLSALRSSVQLGGDIKAIAREGLD